VSVVAVGLLHVTGFEHDAGKVALVVIDDKLEPATGSVRVSMMLPRAS
jgi:hypothetical protein